MAIEAAQASFPLSVGARLSGLNHVAELRARFWGDSEKELTRFLQSCVISAIPVLKRTPARWPPSSSWRNYPLPVMRARSVN